MQQRWQEVLDRINEELQELEVEGQRPSDPVAQPQSAVDQRAEEEEAADQRREDQFQARARVREERVRRDQAQRDSSGPRRWNLREALASKDRLLQAIVLSEVVGKPKSLRDPRDDF